MPPMTVGAFMYKTDPAVTVLMLLICIYAALAFASKASIMMPIVHLKGIEMIPNHRNLRS